MQSVELSSQQLTNERDRLRLLLEINNAVVANLNLHDLLQAISLSLHDCVPHDFTGLAIYDDKIGQLRIHSVEAMNTEGVLSEGAPIPMAGTTAGLAFTTRQTVRRDRLDLDEFDAPVFRSMVNALSIKSACVVPLILQGNAIGVVSLTSRSEAAFSEEDAQLLEQIADQLAIAVGNAVNFESAAWERDRRQLLLEVNNAVVSNLGLRDLLVSVSGWLRKFIKHDFASVVLLDEASGQLRLHALDQPAPGGIMSEGGLLPIDGTPAGLAIITRATVRRNTIDLEEFNSAIVRAAYDAGLRCGMSVCLISHDKLLGTINVGSLHEYAFNEEDQKLLEEIAAQVAIAVENTLNFEQATKERARAETLLEVNNAITTHLNLSDLLRSTSVCCRKYFNNDVTGMALYDADVNQLRVHTVDYDRPERAQAVEGFPMSLNETPAGRAFTTRKPLVLRRFDLADYPSPIMERVIAAGLKSGCYAPLISHDKVLGSAVIMSRREAAFTEADAEMFSHIAQQLAIAVENALQYQEIESLKNKLVDEKLYLEEEIQTEYNFAEIVGQSVGLKKVLQQVETVAPTDSAVLLCGETGTGKELIARAIHNLSARRERTLVKLNCAAIPTGLLESELFGHEKGAFTGAIAQRVGRFEVANKGTLLLDEVGEIPLDLQTKLLRVLQEREFERLGSSRTLHTNARLIAATNRDLEAMVAEQKFRSDLFFRLNVFPIQVPPLRERHGDIPLLVRHFAQQFSKRMNKTIDTISSATMDALSRYHWPGNIRELQNVIERAVITSAGPVLKVDVADLKTSRSSSPAEKSSAQGSTNHGLRNVLEETERQQILKALKQSNWIVAGPRAQRRSSE